MKFYAHEQIFIPTKAHETDAGWDLRAVKSRVIAPGRQSKILTGVRIALPAGTVGLIMPRSSLSSQALNARLGVIDAGYRGEIAVTLANSSRDNHHIIRGDRIAQLVIVGLAPVAWQQVDEDEWRQETTDRGTGGFGSSGR